MITKNCNLKYQCQMSLSYSGVMLTCHFYARKQLLLSARLSHRLAVVLAITILSVCLSVRLSVTLVDQSKTVQARITKSSPSAGRL